jgi:hypothetical protein
MSEYQYYEFQAIDRPLSPEAMDELRALSSRAEITATSFVNVYNYGDFRGDAGKVLAQYFDAFLYVANWGTHRLMFRLPRRLIDIEAFEPYGVENCAPLRVTPEHVIVEFLAQEEGGRWEDGDGQLAPLIPLRSDLLAGDLRCLYLGWLLGVDSGDLEEDEVEPPVPPGLVDLSAPLQALADFLWIDSDLIAAAGEASTGQAPAGPARAELEAWVGALPVPEKDAWLLRLAEDGSAGVRWDFLHSFRQARAKPNLDAAGPKRRTVAELQSAREARAREREQREAAEAARERERRAREKAAAREKHLNELAGREAAAWRQAETLIEAKKAKEYEQAVELLKDLRDLAERAGRKDKAQARIEQIRQRHTTKHSLIKRLREAGLTE